MKQILLLLAPAPLLIVNRPSATFTVTLPSNQRTVLLGVPETASTPSALIRYTLSWWLGSPATIRTAYRPLGTAISHTALGASGFCRWISVSYRWSGEFAALR